MKTSAGTPKTDAERLMAQQLAAYRGGRWLNPKPPSGPAKLASMTDLAAIRVATLIVVGEREVPYLRVVADALPYGIPGAKKVVIPTGGHMVNLVEPWVYNRAILDFLRAVGQ
jgi:pimeloyl-ACP methyl ester carboxylesterase